MDTIDCVVPFRFGRRQGDTWTCPDCGLEWTIDSNLYDSLLPFGDYTWWAERSREGFAQWLLGPRRSRATRFQPEPQAHDLARLARLIHLLDALGLPHTAALAIYDRNAAAGLPYHGAPHGISVALRAHDFGIAEGLDAPNLRPLLLAGIFHDADYVPGDTEEENLTRATAAVRREFPGALGEAAAALIPETEFPHRAPTSVPGAVLQDADLLQCQDTDGPRWLLALMQESGRAADPSFPSADMLHTDAAREYRGRSSRA